MIKPLIIFCLLGFLIETSGAIFYVATNGNDSKPGAHPADPVLTITKALQLAGMGDTVYIYPGQYQEVFPMVVPAGVTIKGHSLRSVEISPTSGTQSNDAFLLKA